MGSSWCPFSCRKGGRAAFLPITECLRLGEELQHDTSPHEVQVGGRKRQAQTASAVLCYSRLLFFQLYPTFQSFDCRVFLTDAVIPQSRGQA